MKLMRFTPLATVGIKDLLLRMQESDTSEITGTFQYKGKSYSIEVKET